MYIVQEIYKPSTVYKQHTSSVQAIYKLRTVYKQHTRNIQAIYKQYTSSVHCTSSIQAGCQQYTSCSAADAKKFPPQHSTKPTLQHRSWYWYLFGMFWVASCFLVGQMEIMSLNYICIEKKSLLVQKLDRDVALNSFWLFPNFFYRHHQLSLSLSTYLLFFTRFNHEGQEFH